MNSPMNDGESPRVLVIEHECDAGIGQFGPFLEAAGLTLVVVGPDTAAELPKDLTGFAGLIVLGGSMGPTDDDEHGWLPDARRLLIQGVDLGVPTLGICLGAQLLTIALGGEVVTNPRGPEVGLCEVQLTEEAGADLLFGALAQSLATPDSGVLAVQWHWLEASILPAEAVVLASSQVSQVQAFRYGNSTWGLQFHPEVLGNTAEQWALESVSELNELGLNASEVIEQVREAEPQLKEQWGGVAKRFAMCVRSKYEQDVHTF